MKHFFLLGTVAMITVKMPFTQQLYGKQFSSSKSCNLLVQTIIEKMESNR